MSNMIQPSQIVGQVTAVLQKAKNYLSAYQILERLPADLRDQIIQERGGLGQGGGQSYSAATVVTMAANMIDGCERIYVDGVGMVFEVAGEPVLAGNEACAFYRFKT